jgi:hypothetical protein
MAEVRSAGDTAETDAPLQSYVHAKQVVAGALREAQGVLARQDAGNDDRLHALLSRLAEDRFHLVVLGQFKRGKSSLINAVVGRELLPTATVPLTSVVTALRYGPAERVLIKHQGAVLPEAVPPSRLAELITERGNPRNEKRILSAEIEVPAPFLRRGLRFIDTPGIGSIHDHEAAGNSATSQGVVHAPQRGRPVNTRPVRARTAGRVWRRALAKRRVRVPAALRGRLPAAGRPLAAVQDTSLTALYLPDLGFLTLHRRSILWSGQARDPGP